MRERNSNNDIFAKSLILLNLNETNYYLLEILLLIFLLHILLQNSLVYVRYKNCTNINETRLAQQA